MAPDTILEPCVRPSLRRPLDPTVKALGIVSLLNDLSSEVAIRTLPLFLANVLGVRTGVIGLIEGVAESTATLLKVGSGYLADRLGRKKVLAVAGYGLSNLAKPLLFFATGWGLVLTVRFLDRVGKGIRTAPRDALIAAASAPQDRGRAFGFNKAMDKAGAVIGLLLAVGVLYASQGQSIFLTPRSYQWLVLLAALPGLVSVVVLVGWVRERPAVPAGVSAAPVWRRLPAQFWVYLAVLVVFTLGNSSDAFLMLRAQTVGFGTGEIFLVVAAFNLVITATSTRGGALSDRLGRRRLIVTGWLIYATIYLGFAVASTRWQVWALYAGYGLYYGAFQGAANALVADLVREESRGTAYGVFNGALGVAALPANLLAGLLWEWYGPAAPFLAGAGLALVASGAILFISPRPRSGV